jgi:mannose-1-phosphate guanylyltransferase
MSGPLTGFKALLLAGGFGTRLKPLTEKVPKCLVLVGGRPLLGYWIETLAQAGIDRILINTHYLADEVADFCHRSQYKHIIDLVYEPVLLGTAGTLRANRHYFDHKILLAHADNFTIFEPSQFVSAHQRRAKQCQATMMTFTTETASSCGIVELSQDGVLIGYYEKVKDPPGNLANAAVFLLEQNCLGWLDQKPDATDFCKDIVPLGLHQIQSFHNTIYHRDIGTPESLQQANRDYINFIQAQ